MANTNHAHAKGAEPERARAIEAQSAPTPAAAPEITQIQKEVQQRVGPPHLTYGVPDSLLKKPLHETKITPDYMRAISGNEQGHYYGEMDGSKYYMVTENGVAKRRNEDGVLIDPQTKTIVVLDGVSQSECGDVPPTVAIHTAAQLLKNSKDTPPVDDLLLKMDDAVQEFNIHNPEVKGSQATAIVARLINGSEVEVAKAGDCRAILIRGDMVVSSTKDDNLLQYKMFHDEIETEEEAEKIYGEDDFKDWRRQITQGLGAPRNLVDIQTGRFDKKINPNKQKFNVQKGDILILCSDGLVDNLSNKEIANFIYEQMTDNKKSLAEAIEALRAETIKTMKSSKGKFDNLTIAAIQI